MLQRWLNLGNTVSDLTVPGLEPQTSRCKDFRCVCTGRKATKMWRHRQFAKGCSGCVASSRQIVDEYGWLILSKWHKRLLAKVANLRFESGANVPLMRYRRTTYTEKKILQIFLKTWWWNWWLRRLMIISNHIQHKIFLFNVVMRQKQTYWTFRN